MASIAVRLQPKHRILASKFQLRSLSSSSSSSPVSPPASSSNEDSSSPFHSHCVDIKSRHRQSAAPPRRIPLNPPKPDVLNASATKTTSLEEIRKHLSGFVRSNSSPKNSSSGNISLVDLFNKNAPEKVGEGGGTNSDRIPHSIFGKELEEESEDSIAANATKNQTSMESRPGSMYLELKRCLSELEEAYATKKQTTHLGGHFTPKYMRGESKEHLVEKVYGIPF